MFDPDFILTRKVLTEKSPRLLVGIMLNMVYRRVIVEEEYFDIRYSYGGEIVKRKGYKIIENDDDINIVGFSQNLFQILKKHV
jgi:hypothetical protein